MMTKIDNNSETPLWWAARNKKNTSVYLYTAEPIRNEREGIFEPSYGGFLYVNDFMSRKLRELTWENSPIKIGFINN